jgi:hypothetical protein
MFGLRLVPALLLISLTGCGREASMPPGGRPAAAYWLGVLEQFPDLPAKVRSVLDRQGTEVYQSHLSSAARVRIYGEDGVTAVSGSRVDLLVTDLDDEALRELLALWESLPTLAAKHQIQPEYLRLAGARRRVIVLGREGRIDIEGPYGGERQSVQVIAERSSGSAEICVHAFGREGEAALTQLATDYHAIRGPPEADVKAGYVGLPPPDDAVAVLVIGRLETLNIAGAADDATQDLSFELYLNEHRAPGNPETIVGETFAARRERLRSAADAYAQPEVPYQASSLDSSSAHDSSYLPANPAPPQYSQPYEALPQVPAPIVLPQYQPPITFQPPLVTPIPAPIYQPPRPFVPRFR